MEAPLSVAVTERDQARGATRSPAVRLYLISVIVPVVAGLAIGAVLNRDRILDQLTTGAPYILALFIVDMFPVPVWRDIRISLGYPLIMFLAVLFQPVAVGIFVLLGAGDPREFTGKSDLLRALFNRSQVAAAAIAAAVVIHSLTPSSGLGPAMLGVAALASLVELAVNMLLVSLAARIDYGEPLKSIILKMPVGNAWTFEAAYLALGVVGVVMALVYLQVGIWAVVSLVPALISMRHMLSVSNRLERAESDLQRKTALQHVAEQLATERHLERQRLAASLHDELAPLLASTGLRLDAVLHNMEGGDLKIVEEIKAAVAADRAAQVAVRALVGELLQSPTGPHGLTEALRRLLTDLATKQGVAVRHDLEAIEAPHAVNELLFGTAREAARNAIQHGKSRSIEVTLQEREGIAELKVTDDGTGFDPRILAGLDHHYGLRLLRERCETAGGSLEVRSSPGDGTAITARVPISPSGKLAAGDGEESFAG